MKIEKLPSGSYRVRKMYKGVTYTVIFESKPTQKEVMQALSEEMDRLQVTKHRMTFMTAGELYNNSKKNVLSPSTLRGYSSVLRSISTDFKNTLISDITAADVQREINNYAKTHAAKTVRNMHGYISAVMSLYCPNTQLMTTLPKCIREEDYIPIDDDIKAVLNAAKGTKYEVPFWLGVFALRRSEVCALDLDDVSDGIITIRKAKVQDENEKWIIKHMTKTEDGMRTISVPVFLTDLIKKQGYVYKGYPNMLLKHLNRIQDDLGIQRFTFHKLRHYYASMAHSIGIPDAYIMSAGGWKSDSVLKGVYRHALKDKQKEMENKAIKYIESNFVTDFVM